MKSTRGSVAPAVVAQRLCDLLLQFPSAALGGVQWRVLVKKYEERYSTQLKIGNLGHSSPIAAATALLWDVLRVVDTSDPDNPKLGVEDAVVLTPRPGFMGSWPSLYRTLCSAVESSGAVEAQPLAAEADGSSIPVVRSLLLSQLKPLLQTTWHANFDENGMGFLNEEGSFVKVKKMKHLVQSVLRWRDQRVNWRQSDGGKLTAVDEALNPKLEVLPSTRHNDLMLRCIIPECDKPVACSLSSEETSSELSARSKSQSSSEDACRRASESSSDIEQELERLRAENMLLRTQNQQLLLDHEEGRETSGMDFGGACSSPDQQSLPARMMEIFDDPYEPPPQRDYMWDLYSPSKKRMSSKLGELSFGFHSASCETPASTAFASSFDVQSGSATCKSMTPISNFDVHSGAMTPNTVANNAVAPTTLGEQVCALVPMWFSLMPSAFLGDRCVIPTGIVERFRMQFETAAEHSVQPRPLSPCKSH